MDAHENGHDGISTPILGSSSYTTIWLGEFWERRYLLNLCPSTALKTRNNELAERSRSQRAYPFREIALVE